MLRCICRLNGNNYLIRRQMQKQEQMKIPRYCFKPRNYYNHIKQTEIGRLCFKGLIF